MWVFLYSLNSLHKHRFANWLIWVWRGLLSCLLFFYKRRNKLDLSATDFLLWNELEKVVELFFLTKVQLRCSLVELYLIFTLAYVISSLSRNLRLGLLTKSKVSIYLYSISDSLRSLDYTRDDIPHKQHLRHFKIDGVHHKTTFFGYKEKSLIFLVEQIKLQPILAQSQLEILRLRLRLHSEWQKQCHFEFNVIPSIVEGSQMLLVEKK